jgi:hypothetical protein
MTWTLTKHRWLVIVLCFAATQLPQLTQMAFAEPFVTPVLPNVYSVRLTDSIRVIGGAQDNVYLESAFLNWAEVEAFGILVVINSATRGAVDGPPRFNATNNQCGYVDGDGRPIFGPNDDANFPPGDGTNSTIPNNPDNKQGQVNTWAMTQCSPTLIRFQGTTPLLPRNLRAAATVGGACSLVPGCVLSGANRPLIENDETIDNGLCPLDNVLDGFVLQLVDFDPGDTLSFNWFLLREDGSVIPDPLFGLGVVNWTRVNRVPSPPLLRNSVDGNQNAGSRRSSGDVFMIAPANPDIVVEQAERAQGGSQGFLAPAAVASDMPILPSGIDVNALPIAAPGSFSGAVCLCPGVCADCN